MKDIEPRIQQVLALIDKSWVSSNFLWRKLGLTAPQISFVIRILKQRGLIESKETYECGKNWRFARTLWRRKQ